MSQQRADGSSWDLHDLNRKLLPFLEFNQQTYPTLKASAYLELESLMMHLNNSKVYSRRFDINNDSTPAKFSERFIVTVSSMFSGIKHNVVKMTTLCFK